MSNILISKNIGTHFLLPVFGILGGWYFLSEKVGFSLIVGFILIVLGVRTVQIESQLIGSG
ncbi:MAG: hypothetical protein CMB61_02770 [Euryarchaeota archaeon]|nr:hypothetical protein [Euryarchaeota archaeon]